jgi:hypothetical protein
MEPTPQNLPTLTDHDKAFAATNDPALSPQTFTLGGREFKMLFLKYKSQLQFMSHLQPLLKMMATSLGQTEVTVPELNLGTSGVSFENMISFCANEFPQMVALICQQTDKTITAAWVEDVAESPVQLLFIIMKQVAVNKMVEHIASFFVSIRPLMMPMLKKHLKIQPSA